MKKFNKKGFTIVELVIVIAVIAILAGVLIPTFSGIVSDANESKALQEARNIYTEIYAVDIADGKIDGGTTFTGVTPPGTIVDCTPNNDGTAVATFNYTAKNGIKVSFDGASWEVPSDNY